MDPTLVRQPNLIHVVHLPFLVTDVIDLSDDIANAELPTMVALHDVDVADIFDGEISGKCRCQ